VSWGNNKSYASNLSKKFCEITFQMSLRKHNENTESHGLGESRQQNLQGRVETSETVPFFLKYVIFFLKNISWIGIR